MEPTHKSSNNDISEIGQDIFRPDGYSFYDELSDTEVIKHPVFTAGINQDWIYSDDGTAQFWPVDNYYPPGERHTNFLDYDVVKQHHTLTQILMGLLHNGFTLQAVEEAMPSPDMLDIPGMKDELRRPMMLLVKAQKDNGPVSGESSSEIPLLHIKYRQLLEFLPLLQKRRCLRQKSFCRAPVLDPWLYFLWCQYQWHPVMYR